MSIEKQNPNLVRPDTKPNEEFTEELKEHEQRIQGEKLTELLVGCTYRFSLTGGDEIEAVFNGWRNSRLDLDIVSDDDKGKGVVNRDKLRHVTYDPASIEQIEV